MWRSAVLKYINPLPCAQCHFALDYRNGRVRWQHRRFDVGEHIIGTFISMGQIGHQRIARRRYQAMIKCT